MSPLAHGIDEVELLLAAHPTHDQARAVLARYSIPAIDHDGRDSEQRTAMNAVGVAFAVMVVLTILATCALLGALGFWLIDAAPGAALALQHWVRSLSPGPLALLTASLVSMSLLAIVATAVAHVASRRPA